MPREVKVVNINDDSTYGEVAEAIFENEKQKTKHLTKPKHKRRNLNHPNPKHERNDPQNLKLLWVIRQLMLIRQLRLKHQLQY